jgi:hypothetical protein
VRVADISATARRVGVSLVAYFVSAAQLGAVVVGHGSPRLHLLGPFVDVQTLLRRVRADLDVLALDRVPDPLRGAALGSLQGGLRRLDAALLEPLDTAGRSLVVVTAGELDTVPWNALPSRRGAPTVATATASAWARVAEIARVRRPSVSALVGPRLARAGEEAERVAFAWRDQDARRDDNADRDSLVSAIAQSDLVHVAAHGVHQADSPLFSSVQMADGAVFAHELDPDQVRASHLVLSACEVGRSTLRPGDEALGLTSVLLRLGVRSVVASVARVNDAAAAEIMAAYHRELALATGSAEALASALARQDNDTPVPFVCFARIVAGGVACLSRTRRIGTDRRTSRNIVG